MERDLHTRSPRFEWQPFLAARLGVDLRGLGAFRVALGLVLLADLALRSVELATFYTDGGVVPRDAVAASYPWFHGVSIHALSGSLWYQAFLVFAAAVAAAALVAGYRARIAIVVAFVLHTSLDARNPFILNGGDALLLVLLFWAMFLPIGTRFTVHAGPRSPRVNLANPASAALLIHVVLVYAVNFLFKIRSNAWLSGDALQYVFRRREFAEPLAGVLVGLPGALKLLDWAWLALLALSPLLVLTTGRARIAVVGLLASAHLGMLLTMRLGLFPFICWTALLPFLPSQAWDALERQTARLVRWSSTARADVPRVPADGADPTRTPTPRRWRQAVENRVVLGLVIISLTWNAASLGYVPLPEGVGATLQTNERGWVMFAEPPFHNVWYVAPATLATGESVDAFHHGPVQWSSPPEPKSVRWLEFLFDLDRPRSAKLFEPLADYLCSSWNDDARTRMLNVTIHRVVEPIHLDGSPGEPTTRPVHEQPCPDA